MYCVFVPGPGRCSSRLGLTHEQSIALLTHPPTVLHCCVPVCAACLQVAAAKHRNIDPLAPVDHSLLEYDDFAKDFYTEHPTIAAMNEQQVSNNAFVAASCAMRRALDACGVSLLGACCACLAYCERCTFCQLHYSNSQSAQRSQFARHAQHAPSSAIVLHA
jgi:hypothetical protein